MQQKVNQFLDNMKFRDLPTECFISITLSKNLSLKNLVPMIITRENSGEWTVGDVVAMSSSVSFLYPSKSILIDGKKWKVLDGGLTLNPPLNPATKNALFSYNNPSSLKPNSWNVNARWPQEKKATAVFNPYTDDFKMLGCAKNVHRAFQFGKEAMEKEKDRFLKDLGISNNSKKLSYY